MPCRKGRLHIVTYRIIDVGLRAGAGIDRIGLECDAESPSLPRMARQRCPSQRIEVSLVIGPENRGSTAIWRTWILRNRAENADPRAIVAIPSHPAFFRIPPMTAATNPPTNINPAYSSDT